MVVNKKEVMGQFKRVNTEKSAIQAQKKLRKYININNNFEDKDIKTIAGVDVSYWKENDREYGVCAIVVMDRESKREITRVVYEEEVEFNYISGCFAFRELPIILNALDIIDIEVDLYMFDGNGYMHPRSMGLATHAGIILEKPTIGVAKTYYDRTYQTPKNIDLGERSIYWERERGNEKYKEEVGRVLRTNKDMKPVFVSVGSNIDLDSAMKIVKEQVVSHRRLPYALAIADDATHVHKKSRAFK